ncbi:MAG: marine proteobacterial sortase target protein [Woeseiaceae bacterium]|nr:marine proteobacterial sortase target protein [Woeseiaceae bacterium]
MEQKNSRRAKAQRAIHEKSSDKNNWHPKKSSSSGKRMRDCLRKAARRNGWPFILLAVLAIPAQAQNGEAADEDVAPDHMQTGSLLLRMKSGYVVATRINTDIEAKVSGLVARVSVRQSFRNTGTEWLEGVYVFPLADNAAVDRMRMHIGERFIEAEIREKEAARKTYEAARSAGKKSSLVEQNRANMFTTSVANIGPGETVVVEIEYLETLAYDEGSFSLRFPLTLTPRYIPGTPLPDRKGNGWAPDTDRVADASLITPPVVSRSSEHKVSFEATINAGLPLELIASRYHPVDISESSGLYRVRLLNPDTPMDHDLELTWRPFVDELPRATLFTETREGQPHLLLMLLPPDSVVDSAPARARELVFVIDTSGSMHGTSLAQATRALTLALDGLGPADRFNVIQFNSVTRALFRGSVDATSNNIGIAKRYVAGLKANGGTEMRPAISLALDYPQTETHLRQVIFITDGSVGNEQELFKLIENKLGATRLFTVGIGSAPNSWFMRKAAEAGHGTFTMISALHEVSEKMQRLFRKLERPQVTDITVQWPHGVTVDAYPQTIPDLYSGEPVVIKARLSNAAKSADQLKLSGNSVLGSWGAELSIDTGDAASGIAALWARARIEDLMDRERRGAPQAQMRKAIIDTALTHHLVSKYTSLVAVDKTPARPPGSALDREQVPNLLPYGQSMNAIFGFPATATDAGMHLRNGLLVMALALIAMLILKASGRRCAPQIHV